MNVIIDHDAPQAVFTRHILASLDVIRADMPDDTVSNVELLLILDAVGDELTRTEVRRLARDLLLERREEVFAAADQPIMQGSDYAELTDSFLSDILTYAVSDTLKVAIADAISIERQEVLKQSFRRRMEQAAQNGLLTLRPHRAANAARTPGLALPRASAVFASVLALAFSNWIALRTAVGATLLTQPIWASERPSIPGGDSVASVKDIADPELQIEFLQLDSQDTDQRARALDWLSAIGKRAEPALPELRDRLKLDDPVLRWEAAWLLAYLSAGSAQDVAALQVSLSDQNRRVRSMAALALGRIGPPARTALPALKTSSVPQAGSPPIVSAPSR